MRKICAALLCAGTVALSGCGLSRSVQMREDQVPLAVPHAEFYVEQTWAVNDLSQTGDCSNVIVGDQIAVMAGIWEFENQQDFETHAREDCEMAVQVARQVRPDSLSQVKMWRTAVNGFPAYRLRYRKDTRVNDCYWIYMEGYAVHLDYYGWDGGELSPGYIAPEQWRAFVHTVHLPAS